MPIYAESMPPFKTEDKGKKEKTDADTLFWDELRMPNEQTRKCSSGKEWTTNGQWSRERDPNTDCAGENNPVTKTDLTKLDFGPLTRTEITNKL